MEKETERPPPNSLVQYARPLWPTDSLCSAKQPRRRRITRQAGATGYPAHLQSSNSYREIRRATRAPTLLAILFQTIFQPICCIVLTLIEGSFQGTIFLGA